MKSREEFRRQARRIDDLIQQAYEVFTDNGREPSVTDEKLETFLRTTEGMGGFAGEILFNSERLALLIWKCMELGWEATRQVYEFMLRTEPIDEQMSSLSSWYLAAISQFLSENRNVPFDERCHFAEDMCRILNSSLDVLPNDNHVAALLGTLYLVHPLRDEDEVSYLEKAAAWFERAETWSCSVDSDGEAFEALLALSDIYFRLEKWNEALGAYKRLKDAYLKLCPANSTNDTARKIDSKIAECELARLAPEKYCGTTSFPNFPKSLCHCARCFTESR